MIHLPDAAVISEINYFIGKYRTCSDHSEVSLHLSDGRYPVFMIATTQLAPHTLAAMELFRGLPPSALEGVAARARVRRLPKELRIFSQGDGRNAKETELGEGRWQ